MFGTTTRAQYFRIANGQIITGQGDNQQTGDFLEGVVTGISRRTIDSKTQKDAKGNPIKVVIYDLDLEDGGETYRLNLMASQSATRDIIRCLVNVENLKAGKIKIRVWATANPANADRPYTNASVQFNGQKVQWAELPKINKISLPNGSVVPDTRAVDAKVEDYVNLISARLTSVAAEPVAPVDNYEEDLPPMEEVDY